MSGKRPAKIGKYDVIDVIGRGGMGIVYKATDPFLDRLVAIKMMTGAYSDNPELLKRFFREAQSTGSLQHPNIVTVFELGDHEGNPYLVMEFLEGESLDSIITSRRELTHLDKINLIVEVCHGLDHAHHRGIVHRDIKPANIMVSSEGVVKIVDFGIAHMAAKNVTKTGQIMGSVSYMAPEQVNGKAVDARTDIFSTGVVLYELLTYTHPFDGESAAATLLKIIHDAPAPLKDFLAQYPPELDGIVAKALAKDREERYHSAEDFALDLGQLQGQLKQEVIAQRLRQVSQLMAQADLYKAREQLLNALKIDRQNTEANLLLREVQQRIQKQQVKEQVLQLRTEAEESFKQQQFDKALTDLQRAIALDPTNVDLQNLRDSVQDSKRVALELQEKIKRAELAHQAGDVDSAKQAVDEALELAPETVRASTLYQTIQYHWEEHTRQRQLETLLDQARREIAGRNFTSALETLRKAEGVEPDAPQLKALIESATLGREQERRRRELDALSREVEEALNRDDYSSACRKADEALRAFPEDRTLLKLKALAEKQGQIAERKQYVDEQLANARTLLEQGRNEELLTLLQSALAKAGPEPRLQSLLLIVRENVEHERTEKRKAEYLQKAKDALRQKAVQEAIRILETAHEELKDSSEISDLLQFAKEQALAEKRRVQVEAVTEKVNALVADQEYEQAIKLLQSTLEEAPDEELRILLADARRAALEYQKKLEATLGNAEKLLQSRKAGEALRLLEAHSSLLARSSAFQKLFEKARSESERLRKIDEFILKSNDALEAGDYAASRSLLQQCRELHGSTPELEQRLNVIAEKESAAAAAMIQKALGDAQILANANQYGPALEKLNAAAGYQSFLSRPVKSAYESLRKDLNDALAHQRVVQFEDLIATGEFTQAETLLQQTLVLLPGHPSLRGLGDVLREETSRRAEAQQAIAVAEELFSKEDWKRGGEILKKAFSVADRVPKIREAVLQTLLHAAETACEKDWRGSETLLQLLSDLQPDFPQPPALLTRIRQRKREEISSQCLQEAKRLEASGDLQGAFKEVERGLSSYPDESGLLAARTHIQDRIQQERERAEKDRARREQDDFVQDVTRRAQSELRLEQRIQVLQEALTRYPEEPRILQQIKQARGLWERVKPILSEARVLEEARKYEQAAQQWNLLRELYPQHPELETNVSRLTKFVEQARAAAKAEWARGVKAALASSDYDRVADLISRAKNKFQEDLELADFEKELQEGLKRRNKAQKTIADGHAALSKKKWSKAVAYLKRACEIAGADPIVREQVSSELLEGCEAAIDEDCPQAEELLAIAAEIRPDSPILSVLRARVATHKREEIIQRHMRAAVSAQSGGDLEGALRQLEQGLSSFPDDPRLLQLKKDVEGRLRLLEETRQQRREAEKERARQDELERQREIEFKRKQELEQKRAKASEQKQKLTRARELEQQAEQVRIEQRQAEQQRKAEQERRRKQESLRRGAQPAEQSQLAHLLKQPRALMIAGGTAAVAVLALALWIIRPHTVPLQITTSPVGSTIRVQGTDATCVTPNCDLKLPPGKYQIQISRDDYETRTESIEVAGKGPNAFSIALSPVATREKPPVGTPSKGESSGVPAPPQRSSVEISGWTPGSKVIIDGAEQGIIGKRGTFSTSVTPEQHNLKVIEKNGESGTIQRPFLAGQRVLLPKADFGLSRPNTPPATATRPPLNPEERDWQQAREASTVAALENFRQQYPNNPHQAELQDNLDNLYWEKAKAAPSAAAFDEYLGKFPNGKHRSEAQEIAAWNKADAANSLSALRDYQKQYPQGVHSEAANKKIQDLRFQTARSSEDDAVLDAFLRDYPSGAFHDQISGRRDDLAWKKTAKADAASLQAYLSKFPNGSHAAQARSEMQKLAEASIPSTPNTPAKPIIDEKKAILDVISQYNEAYNDRSIEALRRIWPSMDYKRVSAERDFFNSASSVTSSYKLDQDPQINGNDATVKMTQTLGYEINGKQEKPRASKVTVRLTKKEGAGSSGGWEIQSVGK